MANLPTLDAKVSASGHDIDTVLPSEFVVAARVKCARFVPRWVTKRRWVVLRGSKSPILSVYRQDPRRLEPGAPLRMLLLGEDTRMRVVGEKRLVLVSSRVRKDDTLSLEFETAEQRQLALDTLSRWIALAVLLQRLSAHESIAKSPNSAVYLCHDCYDPAKQFVLKRVHRFRCRDELSLTARLMTLSRENRELGRFIPRYSFLFEDNKAKCVTIVMDYYPGGSLADRVRERGPLPEALACNVLIALCRALSLLHEHHVLHLDVKASNILFDDDQSGKFSNLKLVDFGSGACLDSNSSRRTELSEKMASAGTYGCMAPERFRGCCGPEADVYGAGIMLYHMLAGVIPFSGADTYQLLARNMLGDVSYGEKQWELVSPQLKDLTARMLEKNPAKRIALTEILNLPWLSSEPESIDATMPEIMLVSSK
ncbi:hypothetical protein PHYSODRAFT_506287 [Phytophthora sojae]|uniref:Protein kinase domain-containing protein n=1 Tax=Phytophthora sojae (strain P6497) TaxID=1094619 RepID=G4ZM39_PHYSP|nr:hypothetical protein PHYSODRAFT_506287 [Phytophthora sojae]EGZ16006.1 hypothetical protein PHYSODRAFT_506287 [Phytophthora sojae]|eukprot:XP_009529755.1 hypothetical protein PHYSODRAFT_506287 [Phytophthora sojae]